MRSVALAPSLGADLLELTKPRITALVTLTTAAGFLLGTPSGEAIRIVPFVVTVLGTGLVAAGSAALNHHYERETDARMRRTANRPLPAGRLHPDTALLWGALLAATGLLPLALLVGPLTAALAAATLVTYVWIYTPLKRVSSLATLVGAIPGAAPPLLGWTGATGTIDLGAWLLFAVLFLWQLPHFLAIAWLYHDDYRAAGLHLLSIDDPDFGRTTRQAVLYAVALLPVSLLPPLVGFGGRLSLAGAAVLGAAFVGVAVAFGRAPTRASARNLLLASVAYLPALLAVWVIDHRLLLAPG
jgi:protoheme IX farnesyltransferase